MNLLGQQWPFLKRAVLAEVWWVNLSCILVRKGAGTVQAGRTGRQEGSRGEAVRSI